MKQCSLYLLPDSRSGLVPTKNSVTASESVSQSGSQSEERQVNGLDTLLVAILLLNTSFLVCCFLKTLVRSLLDLSTIGYFF